MAPGNTLYLFSGEEQGQASLQKLVDDLGRSRVPSEAVNSLEELRGKLEGGQAQFVLIDGKHVGPKLLECLGEPDPDNLLSLSLAELEKRHIFRVLASTGGNKSRAARILGIDTKTLYNKLKSYEVGADKRRRSSAMRREEATTAEKTMRL
ncbi:MAG: hypothetical protein KDC95_04395 [Planctomycetes bacterium]|nr:hypothetical protein [Planctomycetota bacterium]